MKKIVSRRGGLIKSLLLIFLVIPILFVLFKNNQILENPILLILTFIPLIICLWIYFGTYYIVNGHLLLYRSAFISGQIEVKKITEISKEKTLWIGLKPAAATNGLLIKFNMYDELYISPENNDAMIDCLTEINHSIKITQ